MKITRRLALKIGLTKALISALGLLIVMLAALIWHNPTEARPNTAMAHHGLLAELGQLGMSLNPLQIAKSQWYATNETGINFSTGSSPAGIAFDGANIWVANQGSNSVTKFRASDGANLGAFTAGRYPQGIAFDGTNIWVTNANTNTVSKR